MARAPDDVVGLTPEQARSLLLRHPELARAAEKWRKRTGRDGRLIVIDPAIVREVLSGELEA